MAYTRPRLSSSEVATASAGRFTSINRRARSDPRVYSGENDGLPRVEIRRRFRAAGLPRVDSLPPKKSQESRRGNFLPKSRGSQKVAALFQSRSQKSRRPIQSQKVAGIFSGKVAGKSQRESRIQSRRVVSAKSQKVAWVLTRVGDGTYTAK